MRTLEQQRASAALDAVNDVSKRADLRGKYRQRLESFPAQIRILGLVQAWALLDRDCQDGSDQASAKSLRADMVRWLGRSCPHLPLRSGDGSGVAEPERALARLFEIDQASYLVVHREAVAYAGWLKRLAQALLPKEARE